MQQIISLWAGMDARRRIVAILSIVALIVTVSVTSRTLGLGGLKGDFEIVEFGAGMAAFLFLPYCQLRSSHVMVDLFSFWMPQAGQKRLDQLWELVFAAAWSLVAWRLYLGGAEMLHYGDRSILLRMPMWFVFVPAVLATAFSAIVAVARVIWGERLALHRQGVIE